MICKKCGAYNPDHATFCKVCAANLKEQPDVDEAKVSDAEEVVEEELRPRRGNVKAPDFSAARRAGTFKAAQKVEEPEEEDVDEEDLDEEEEVKPAKKSSFARPAAPVKKRRVIDEDEDDEDDEDDYDEEDEAEKLESEPKTSRFARPTGKKRRVVEEEDDEDEEDEDDDEDDEEYDDEDDYEEYEPTPPRRKNTSRSKSKSNGSSFCWKGRLFRRWVVHTRPRSTVSTLSKACCVMSSLAKMLRLSCVLMTVSWFSTPTDAPVTGTQVDYSATTMEEIVDDKGVPSISIKMVARPGDTLTIVLPNQDDYVTQNTTGSDQPYQLTIPKSCFFPNTPLTDSVYTVTPQILVAHADGTQDALQVDSFDITFPTLQLELTEPAQATIPEAGIMASEGNEITLKGKVDDHTVTVTVNGQPVLNMYEGGNFEYTYSLSGEEAEIVTIEASKANCVSTSYAFTVTPYIFVPEEMPLTVETDISKLSANKNNRVTVTGVTSPGATLTATPAAEYQSSVACGAPTVDPEGNYSFEVTFDKSYYGIASITIHAKKDGFEEGEITCYVYRMYADRKAAINGYNKTKTYHEVPSGVTYEKVMENPTVNGLYRFVGKVVEVDPETGVMTFAAKTNRKDTVNIYVRSAIANWDVTKQVNKSFKLYCTLNGLYTDGTSLYAIAWFQLADK